ncbi:unnamed protein product [Gordionus sp. m RMFG-2023]|uniref:uncharacterized protein LOC135928921 isoform X2 n=1 Tax=Gordionus sp. m RMFG-2023 TaxID=3053472 RepID=UPI0030E1867B
MVDLGAYVLLLIETKDKKIKLYGSPAEKNNLEIGDEVLEINGRSLENYSHDEAIAYIHKCIRSKTICLKVKRKSESDDIDSLNDITDAYAIAVEKKAKERLEKLAAKHNFCPLDMTKLSEPLTSPYSDDNFELPTSSTHDAKDTDYPIQDSRAKKDIITRSSAVTTTVVLAASDIALARQPSLQLLQKLRKSSAIEKGSAPVTSQRKYSTPSSIYTISGLTENEQDYLNRDYIMQTPPPDPLLTRLNGTTVPENRELNAKIESYKADLGRAERDRRSSQKEKEFLRSSLRGSKKLQALEELQQNNTRLPVNDRIDKEPIDNYKTGFNANGFDNEAFSPEDTNLIKNIVGGPLPPSFSSSYKPRIAEHYEDLDIDKILAKMNEMLKNGPDDSNGRNEDYNNISTVKAFLQDRKFMESFNIYKNVVKSLKTSLDRTNGHRDSISLLNSTHQILNNPQLQKHSTQSQLKDLSFLLQKPPLKGLLSAYDDILTNRKSYLNDRTFSRALSSDKRGSTTDNEDNRVENLSLGMTKREGYNTGSEEYLSHTLDQYPETANIKIVRIEKGLDPLGATIRNEGDSVVVARVVANGAAARSGSLLEGDALLELNGTPLRGKSVHEVCDIIMRMSSAVGSPGDRITGTEPQQELVFVVDRTRSKVEGDGVGTAGAENTNENVMSVRANFNYDPEEDLYIPCRELGLSFQKGDILHVINQDDINWWQAYRDGEDMQGLAGLIPSKSFQIQRETLRMALFASEDPKSKRSRQNRKKHKSASKTPPDAQLYLNNSLASMDKWREYPNSSTSNNVAATAQQHPKNTNTSNGLCGPESLASRLCQNAVDYCSKKKGSANDKYNYPDEYECDEILTYEEVELCYPIPDKKRPIVLIGPPDIGRHELRQKLMENFPERFAASVPHTSRPQKFGEIDGQDYHFLNRQSFEADIMAGKFVEHGEFEKSLYGTSLASIRQVIASGKNCVLNLHPQSLKILYESDVMPYVVFIAPPNIEKLKLIQEKRGVFKKEEELAEIIEKSREIEENFGHYFDVFIVNTDLDKTYNQLLEEINRIECEPQWVPKFWLHLNTYSPSRISDEYHMQQNYDPSSQAHINGAYQNSNVFDSYNVNGNGPASGIYDADYYNMESNVDDENEFRRRTPSSDYYAMNQQNFIP